MTFQRKYPFSPAAIGRASVSYNRAPSAPSYDPSNDLLEDRIFDSGYGGDFPTAQPEPWQQDQQEIRRPGRRIDRPSNARKWLSRVAMVGALVGGAFGVEAVNDAVAGNAASKPSCYGDYCSGQYADKTGCDKDAKTIATSTILKSGPSLSVTMSQQPGVTVGNGGTEKEVGKLELRESQKCGTVWARLNTKVGGSIGFAGLTSVGVQQDGGYTQERKIKGAISGAPAAISFSPMIYGRDRTYRAYVKSRNYNFPSQDGTYWTEA